MGAMGASFKVVADSAFIGEVREDMLSSTSVGYYIKTEVRFSK